jgi:hypothetical protein
LRQQIPDAVRDAARRRRISALVNVIWGWFNFIVGGALLRIFFPPLPPPPAVSLPTLAGVLVMAVWLSNHFSKVRSQAPHP